MGEEEFKYRSELFFKLRILFLLQESTKHCNFPLQYDHLGLGYNYNAVGKKDKPRKS